MYIYIYILCIYIYTICRNVKMCRFYLFRFLDYEMNHYEV